MTDEPKRPPGFSAFKALLERIAKVPKEQIDEREDEYQRERAAVKKRRSAG